MIKDHLLIKGSLTNAYPHISSIFFPIASGKIYLDIKINESPYNDLTLRVRIVRFSPPEKSNSTISEQVILDDNFMKTNIWNLDLDKVLTSKGNYEDFYVFILEIKGNPRHTIFQPYGVYLSQINQKLIENLRIIDDKKVDLLKITESYLKRDYKGVINEISIMGEYIARKMAYKLKKKPYNDFGSAVRALANYKENPNTKTKYSYIGSLLWPLYYARNQKLHAFSDIKFDKHYAEALLKNLSIIITYLSINNIKID